MDDQQGQDLERRMQQTMAAVWKKYLPLNRERVAQIERAVDAARKKELTHALRLEAESEAHKLAGASGTMGHKQLYGTAQELEEIFRVESELDQKMLERLESLAERLRSEFEATES